MVSNTIQVEAHGELTTFMETGIATYRFEQTLPQSPLVMMLHLHVDPAQPGVAAIAGAKLKLSIEVPDVHEKLNSPDQTH